MDLQREFGKQVQLIPMLLREGKVINMGELHSLYDLSSLATQGNLFPILLL